MAQGQKGKTHFFTKISGEKFKNFLNMYKRSSYGDKEMKITRRQLRQIIRESIREEAGALREVTLEVGSDVARHLANQLRAVEQYINSNIDRAPRPLQAFARSADFTVTTNQEAIDLLQRAEDLFGKAGIDIYELPRA